MGVADLVPAGALMPNVSAHARLSARVLREPLLHFLLSGAVLFVAERVAARHAWLERPVIVITAAEQARRVQAWSMQTGRAPGETQRQLLVEEAIEDEVLYREALVRGLDHGNPTVRSRLINQMKMLSDPETTAMATDDALYEDALELNLGARDAVIRRHLVLQMRLLASLPAGPEAVTDADLQALLQRRADLFLRPEQWSFSQVFFSKRLRGVQARRDAQHLLHALQTGDGAVSAQGDPLPTQSRVIRASAAQIDATLGAGFADRLASIGTGTWAGPVESPFGFHLVRVDERVGAALPALAEVRPRLRETLRHERALARFADYYPQLRARYDVRVEDATAAAAGRVHRLSDARHAEPDLLD